MEKEPGNQKKPFLQRLRDIFRHASMKEIAGVLKDTVRDLKKPKEIGILITGSFIPGGWVGYGIYRIQLYRKKKAANNNTPQGKKKSPPNPAP